MSGQLNRADFFKWLLKAAVGLLIALPSARAYEVLDSQNLLPSLATWVGAGSHNTSFTTSMKCGQTAQFEAKDSQCQIHCTAAYCYSMCTGKAGQASSFIKLYTDECTADVSHVFGDNGLIVEVNKTDFEKDGGYWVRPFLQQLTQFLQPEPTEVVIDSKFVWPERLILDGQMRTVPVVRLGGKVFFMPGMAGADLEVYVAPELDGLNQILRLSVSGAELMKFRGLIDGPGSATSAATP